MKSFKLLVSGAFVLALLAPVFIVGSVSAQAQQGGIVNCSNGDNSTTANCDLAIQKEVSINGGAFVDANTSGDAAQGNLGDSIVWRISVTNPMVPSAGFFPAGTFIVGDNFPANATFVDADPTVGSYDSVNHQWTFSLGNATVYPVVMTMDATPNSTGLVQNYAFLSGYYCDGDEEPCGEYSDANNTNDGDWAFAEFSAAPVVLADETEVLAATGSGLVASLLAAGLIISTAGVLAYNHISRRN